MHLFNFILTLSYLPPSPFREGRGGVLSYLPPLLYFPSVSDLRFGGVGRGFFSLEMHPKVYTHLEWITPLRKGVA